MRISHTVWGIIVAAAFVSGAFLASPELRAYAADTVFSTDIVDGEVKSVDIGTGEVKAVDIGAAAVTSPKIATGAVTSAKIGTGAVTNAKIATNAIDSSKILDGSIAAADIADGAVTNSKLAADSIDSSKIADNQIMTLDIADGQVRTADILDSNIIAADLAADSVGGSEMQGVTILGFGTCPINPPEIDGTDESDQGRVVVFTPCILPSGTESVIAYPSAGLAHGLVPCGSMPSGANPPALWVCIQNVFDQTNVDDSSQTWGWIAFTRGNG